MTLILIIVIDIINIIKLLRIDLLMMHIITQVTNPMINRIVYTGFDRLIRLRICFIVSVDSIWFLAGA